MEAPGDVYDIYIRAHVDDMKAENPELRRRLAALGLLEGGERP